MAATATKKEATIADKLDALFELQKIDSKIDSIRTIRGELPLEVQDLEDEIGGLNTRIAKINDEIKEIETEISDRKIASKDSETAIAKYKEQQNNVRNNREFESLSKEIEFQELEIKLHEKKSKEAKLKIENKKEILTEATDRLDMKVADLDVKKSEIYRRDANELVREIKADVYYIDPPYNSRQYSRFYHVLETLTKWDSPVLSGVALKPPIENISEYCKVGAPEAFAELIENIQAKLVIVSYNNTYNSKSSSSKNKITLEQIEKILRKKVDLLKTFDFCVYFSTPE
jgi:adenine-specific DNA methylase